MIEITLGIIYMVIIGCVTISMAVLILKEKKGLYNYLYAACQMSVVIWCSSQIMLLLSQTLSQQRLAYTIGNFGICFIGCFWLLFCFSYNDKEGKLPKGWFSLCLISAIFYLANITNRFHHMYYREFLFEEVTYGPLFYGNLFYTYACVLFGVGMLLKRKSLSRNVNVHVAKIMIQAAAMIPMVINIIQLCGKFKVKYDVTPLGFGISTILVLYATLRYRFLEVNITAFDTIIHDLSDGIILFTKAKATYSNQVFWKMLNMEEKEFFYKDWKKYVEDYFVKDNLETSVEMSELLKDKNKIYYHPVTKRYISVEEIHQNDKKIILILKDVSPYYELLEKNRELAISKQQYALSKERNRIAQSVHDTTGHTLVMIQSLLKLAMIERGKTDLNLDKDYIQQAKNLSTEGLKELREAINQMRQEENSQLVTQAVMQLASQVHEIEVKVTFQGEDNAKYSYYTKVIYDTLRESITNCLKYAKATTLEVVVRFLDTKIELLIADNGQGCKDIIENNGLRGIRERIEEKKGQVRFVSGDNEGFLTKVVLNCYNM